MALIKCIECGNKISDKAKICPHCGYSLNKKAIKKGRKLQNRENMWHNIKAASDTVQKATENNHTNTSSASDYQGQSHKNIPPIFGWIVSVFFILLGILFLLDSTTSAGLMMLSGLIINPMIRTKARIPLGIAVILSAVLLCAGIIMLPPEDTSADDTAIVEVTQEKSSTESSDPEVLEDEECRARLIGAEGEFSTPYNYDRLDGTINGLSVMSVKARNSFTAGNTKIKNAIVIEVWGDYASVKEWMENKAAIESVDKYGNTSSDYSSGIWYDAENDKLYCIFYSDNSIKNINYVMLGGFDPDKNNGERAFTFPVEQKGKN